MRRRAIIGGVGSGLLGGCLRLRDSSSEDPTEEPNNSDQMSTEIPNQKNRSSTRANTDPNRLHTWEFRAEAPLTRPVVGEECVFAGSVDQTFYALDKSTGETLWTVDRDNEFSTATVVEEELYTYVGGFLLRIDLSDGEVLEELRATSSYIITDDLIIIDYTLLGSIEASGFVAFDRVDGTERWRSELGGSNGLAIGENVFVFGNDDNTNRKTRVHALDRGTGEELWSLSRDELTEERVKLAFATHDGIIAMVADTGTVYGIDAVEGTVLWKTETSHQRDPTRGGNDFPTPTEFDGQFVICSLEVQALDVETGEVNWTAGSDLPEVRTEPRSYKNSGLTIVDGIAYYPTGNGDYDGIIGVTSSGEIAIDTEIPDSFEELPTVDERQRYYVSHTDATLRSYEQI